MSEICEVQKIINKREQNGKIYFLIKWAGLSHFHNTWEPEENLIECDEALHEFEQGNAIRILSSKQNEDGNIQYLVQTRSHLKTELILAERVTELWPQQLISFLEERIVWRRAVNFDGHPPVESEPVGEAKRISYVTNVGSKLQYWVEFDDGSRFVSSKEARKHYGSLIIDYLQPHLIVEDAEPTVQE